MPVFKKQKDDGTYNAKVEDKLSVICFSNSEINDHKISSNPKKASLGKQITWRK